MFSILKWLVYISKWRVNKDPQRPGQVDWLEMLASVHKLAPSN